MLMLIPAVDVDDPYVVFDKVVDLIDDNREFPSAFGDAPPKSVEEFVDGSASPRLVGE
jgi:cephalosporin hydroxylase